MSDGSGGRRATAQPHHLRTLTILALLSIGLYVVIAHLSWHFTYSSPVKQRPIPLVLSLFAGTFALYLFAIRIVSRAKQNRRLLMLVTGSAIAFRAVMLHSAPIQEIDIYRYLWDGASVINGVSPFRYSPAQVIAANATPATTDTRLARLTSLPRRDPALATILSRIHFGELPTVYPPASQAVFAAAALTTPPNASVATRIIVMKAWIVGFDLATLLVVVGLLRRCRKPPGLSLIYGWCPLTIKEFANSGHLDAVAVFLTTLAVYLVVRFLTQPHLSTSNGRYRWKLPGLATFVLALAVGAKLYPIVLAPLLLAVVGKRVGWPRALWHAAAFAGVTVGILWPMLPVGKNMEVNDNVEARMAEGGSVSPQGDPSRGLRTFLRRWEMNDFLFLILVENLKPATDVPHHQDAWFSVLPNSWRQSIGAAVQSSARVAPRDAPFLTARALTVAAFVAVALSLAWLAAARCDPSRFCEAGFLTVAWFWLLCPTQNPWYWTWALPLLPFARSRAWLAVSGLVFLYYLRFWFGYHWHDMQVLATPYVGAKFFDLVVSWVEFAPWFVWLFLSFILRSKAAPAH